MIDELRLQRGKPVDIDICKVHPLTLDEIDEMGFLNYNQFLYYLLLDKDSLNLETATKEEIDNIKTSYDVLTYVASKDEITCQLLLLSFSIFLKEQVSFNLAKKVFMVGNVEENRIITSDHYKLIKQILQKQNYLQETKQKEFKAANDKTAQLMEKMKKAKEKIQKQQKDEQISLSDIVSIVATYSNNLNILNVWNLTVYQLYMCYMRIMLWDEYHNNFILLPHVDKQENLNLKHWATKLNN